MFIDLYVGVNHSPSGWEGKGEGKPKLWGPRKMTKRTQFAAAPIAISAYETLAYRKAPAPAN